MARQYFIDKRQVFENPWKTPLTNGTKNEQKVNEKRK